MAAVAGAVIAVVIAEVANAVGEGFDAIVGRPAALLAVVGFDAAAAAAAAC